MTLKELESMKKADLQVMAQAAGVSTSGTIKELAARLSESAGDDVAAEVELDTDEMNETAAASGEAGVEELQTDITGTLDEAVIAAAVAENVSIVDTNSDELVQLEALQVYHDQREKRIMAKGEVFEADAARAKHLVEKGFAQKV